MKGKRALAADLLERSGVGRLLRAAGSWKGLLILNYHRLAERADDVLDTGVWSATPDEFAAQLAFLKRETELLAPADLPPEGPPVGGRFTLITFDDGYRDNYTLAFPVLRSLGLRAAFFPTTAWVDEAHVSGWDELTWMVRERRTRLDEDGDALALSLLRRFRTLSPAAGEELLDELAATLGTGRLPGEQASELWMTWDQMREMHAAGMTFGGHTAHHVCLSSVDAETQRREVETCRARLTTELGSPPEWFAYPFGMAGSFNADTRAVLAGAGVSFGCSQYGGYTRLLEWDPYNLRRVAVEREHSPRRFASMVSWPAVFAR